MDTANISYQRLKNTDLVPEVIDLIARFYGPGFFLEEEAQTFLENRVGHYAFGAFDADNNLIGVCLGKTLDNDRMGYYNRLLGDLLTNDLVFDFLDAHSSAINVLVVDEKLIENSKALAESIAEHLAELVLDKLEQISNLVFADIWHGNGKDFYASRRRVFEKMGFRKFRVIKNFWTKYTEEMPEAKCPVCGNPCNCSAVIFYKKINQS